MRRVQLTGNLLQGLILLLALSMPSWVSAQPYPEAFGADDFRISVMGPENNLAFTASQVRPAIHMRSLREEGLIVWRGNDQGKEDIFARRIRINGLGGTGSEIPLSMPADVVWPDIPRSPDIACLPMGDVCIVVWVGEVDGDPRVFWRRIDENTGLPIEESQSQFLSGYLGAPVTVIYDTYSPVSGSPFSGSFLILTMIPCGTGTDTTVVSIRTRGVGSNVDVDQHVLEDRCLNTQRLNMALVPQARGPIVVWNDWSTDGNFEIFAAYGLTFGGDIPDNSRISITNNGSSFGYAVWPDVVYATEYDKILVVWEANGDAGTTAGESEIHGQFLAVPANEEVVHPQQVGPDDFRISFTDPVGSTTRDSFIPSVAWDRTYQVFAVTWHSDDQAFLLQNNEFEAFMQGVTLDGNLTRPTALRLSRMGGPDQLGGTGDSTWDALETVVATSRGRAVVAWWGSQQMFPLNIGGETRRDDEIGGQTVLLGPPLAPENMFEDSYEALP